LSHVDCNKSIVIGGVSLGVVRMREGVLVRNLPSIGVVKISDSHNEVSRGHEIIGKVEIARDLVGLVGPIIITAIVSEDGSIIGVGRISSGIHHTVGTLSLDPSNKEQA